MSTRIRNLGILACALGVASIATAAPITATFTTFGALPGATFGGTGIPNNAVAITTSGELTLGLTATQRFGAPALTNNGAGVFTAQAGVSADAPSPADPYALWNFGFYIAGSTAAQYSFRLFYDFDPAADTEQAEHGRTLAPAGAVTSTSQGSWNLGMNFLELGAPIVEDTPLVPSFDPRVAGQYSFALVAYSSDEELARTAIVVNVNAVPVPEPTSLALAGLALAALGLGRRRAR